MVHSLLDSEDDAMESNAIQPTLIDLMKDDSRMSSAVCCQPTAARISFMGIPYLISHFDKVCVVSANKATIDWSWPKVDHALTFNMGQLMEADHNL